jgi:hypothetical protein
LNGVGVRRVKERRINEERRDSKGRVRDRRGGRVKGWKRVRG